MSPPPDRPDPMTDPPTPGKPVVFLGPSLPVVEAEALVDAEYRPPIRRGDLGTIDPGRVVLIVDGEFDQSYPVSPKEIGRALDSGMVVVGASSMGALKAAEMTGEGMIGIGRIFEAYRSGRIVGDDEVAMTYCPLSFEPRTIPLVHVRFWLDQLAGAGFLTDFERATCLRRARRVFYADRTPARLSLIFDAFFGAEQIRRIRAAGFGAVPDVKAADARTALSAVARMVDVSSIERSRV